MGQSSVFLKRSGDSKCIPAAVELRQQELHGTLLGGPRALWPQRQDTAATQNGRQVDSQRERVHPGGTGPARRASLSMSKSTICRRQIRLPPADPPAAGLCRRQIHLQPADGWLMGGLLNPCPVRPCRLAADDAHQPRLHRADRDCHGCSLTVTVTADRDCHGCSTVTVTVARAQDLDLQAGRAIIRRRISEASCLDCGPYADGTSHWQPGSAEARDL